MSRDEMNTDDVLGKIKDLIDGSKTIAIISHFNPDPDAYGSICGLMLGLRSYNKELDISCYNQDGIKEEYHYIPAIKEVLSDFSNEYNPDLVIICDCGDKSRIGEAFLAKLNSYSCPTICIDHHVSNPLYGTENLVKVGASSTCEIVYNILDFLNVKISEEIALALLSGIVGDTGGFRYRSTSAQTLRVASVLVDAGASLSLITEQMYGSVAMSTIRLESFALQNLQLLKEGRIAGVVITDEHYELNGATSDDGEMLAEIIRDIKGVRISYSIRRMDEIWKVSLRTSSPDIDLASVASSFGGGGHAAAAAFRFSQDIEDILPVLQKKLSALL